MKSLNFLIVYLMFLSRTPFKWSLNAKVPVFASVRGLLDITRFYRN